MDNSAVPTGLRLFLASCPSIGFGVGNSNGISADPCRTMLGYFHASLAGLLLKYQDFPRFTKANNLSYVQRMVCTSRRQIADGGPAHEAVQDGCISRCSTFVFMVGPVARSRRLIWQTLFTMFPRGCGRAISVFSFSETAFLTRISRNIRENATTWRWLMRLSQ
jgi:hypothetical protein